MKLRAYWSEFGEGKTPDQAEEMPVDVACDHWADLRGVQGHFFGLIDEDDNTIQFYFEQGIPDHVDDARHLEIVLVDFPVPSEQGSYQRTIKIGEADALIRRAFEVGAGHEHFDQLEFKSWG